MSRSGWLLIVVSAMSATAGLIACSSSSATPSAGGPCAAPCTSATPTSSTVGEPDAAPVITELGFTLDSAQVTVAQKSGVDIGLSILRPPGNTEPLELEVTNLPAGATATKVTVLEAQTRASVRINAGVNTPQGPQVIDVTLRGASKVVTQKVTLSVIGSPGAIDVSFAASGPTPGRTTSAGNIHVLGFATQPDGKHVLSGILGTAPARDFGAVRFLADGTSDTSFGNGGLATVDFGTDEFPYGLTSQSDGKLVGCGNQNNTTAPTTAAVVARWTADGKLDTTFGAAATGKVVLGPTAGAQCFSIKALPDDTLVASVAVHNGTDYDFAMMKLTKVGVLDTTFGPDAAGYVKVEMGGHDFAYGFAMDATGKYVAAGSHGNGTGYDAVLGRFTSNGIADKFSSVDKSWTTLLAGGANEAFGWSVLIQPDGKIVAGGTLRGTGFGDFVLFRVDANGAPDPSFGSGGKLTMSVGEADRLYDMQLDALGRIVFVGQSDPNATSRAVVGRVTADGKPDITFGNAGLVALDVMPGPDYGAAVRVQQDGRILVAGTNVNGTNVPWVVRLWP